MQVERVQQAIQTGEILRVRYFGGSTPGAERQIQPIAVTEEKVRALCLQSGDTKMFVLSKLEEVIDGVPSLLAATLPPPLAICNSIAEFAAMHRNALEALGWLVQAGETAITLHRRFKNGKPRGVDVSLSFDANPTYDLVFDGEKLMRTNYRERERPWVVAATKKKTISFANAAKAQALFLDQAHKLGPDVSK